MDVRKMVVRNAVNAGAAPEIATLLGAKFQRYHTDQRDSEKGGFNPRATKASAEDLQAAKSRSELVAFVAKEKAAQTVEKTADALEQSAANRGPMAAVWTGALGLFAACSYFVVDAIRTIDRAYNGIGASMPLPERTRLAVSAVVGILAMAAAGIATLFMKGRREKAKDVAFDLRQVAIEARKDGKKD